MPGVEDGALSEREKLETRHRRAIQAVFDELLRRIVPSGTREDTITPELALQRYHEHAGILRDALIMLLQEAALAGVAMGRAQVEALMGVGPRANQVRVVAADWDLVNQRVIDWILGGQGEFGTGYGDTLAAALAHTSEGPIRTQIAEWIRNGLPLRALVESLEATVFSRERAELVAVTEVTRAFSVGMTEAWRASGIIRRRQWQTAADELVCFPAGTMVATEWGQQPIERIVPGTKVQTRQGLRRVLAISKRLYVGPMTRVRTALGDVVATARHRFWTLEQGWLECGNLTTGHSLQTLGEKPVKVLGVFNFKIGNSADSPAVSLQVGRLARVPSGVAVPVYAVNLQSNTQASQEKIDAVAPHLGFLDVADAEYVKCGPYSPLQSIFTSETAVAGKAAKLPVSIARQAAKLLATSRAGFDNWRPSAFFRAVMAVQAFFGNKRLTAPFANLVFGARRAALTAADGISVGNSSRYREGLATDRADFLNHLGSACSLITGAGAKLLVALDACRRGIELLSAICTGSVLASAFSLSRSKSQFLGSQWHSAQLLSDMRVLYHRLFARPIYVYNLQVEDLPEFYANGLLVHNCPICGPLQGQVRGLDEEFDGGVLGPPRHPRCRCWLSPVVPDAASGATAGPPTPTRPVLLPDGIPVSMALQLPKRSRITARLRAGVAAIDRAHGDGQFQVVGDNLVIGEDGSVTAAPTALAGEERGKGTGDAGD